MLPDRCPVLCVLSCLSVTLVYCGQTVGWIKMKIGTEVGLSPGFSSKRPAVLKILIGVGPGDIVLDGDPAPPKKAQPPSFGPCLLWRNGRPSQLLLSSCIQCWAARWNPTNSSLIRGAKQWCHIIFIIIIMTMTCCSTDWHCAILIWWCHRCRQLRAQQQQQQRWNSASRL